MERRDFLKRLGFAGAAAAVTPQILAQIKPDPVPPPGDEITVTTPDGREIPCKSFTLEVKERPGNGGIYIGDVLVFKIYDWSLDIVRPLIDVSRDPRYATKENPVPPYKEYERGPYSASVNGSGCLSVDYISLDDLSNCRLVLYDNDNVYDAEGYITALSYGADIGGPIENALTFQISGPITRTSRI